MYDILDHHSNLHIGHGCGTFAFLSHLSPGKHDPTAAVNDFISVTRSTYVRDIEGYLPQALKGHCTKWIQCKRPPETGVIQRL